MRNMMLRWWMLLPIILILVAPASAAGPQFAVGGGGPGIGLFMPDLAEINAFVEGAGFVPFEGDLFLIGGGGRGGLVPGLTWGGAGWGAWIESEDAVTHAEYGLGLGGFDLGFAVGGSPRSVLTFGTVFGCGAAEIVLTEYPSIQLERLVPRGIVVEPTQEMYDSLFFLVAPYIDVQIQLLPWMGFGIRAGYVWAPIELNWVDRGSLDPPSLAPSGSYVRFSLRFGGIADLRFEPEESVIELPETSE